MFKIFIKKVRFYLCSIKIIFSKETLFAITRNWRLCYIIWPGTTGHC